MPDASSQPDPSQRDTSGGTTGDDDSILDAALARFLDDVAEGREPDVAGAAAGRSDLVAQIRELAAMAKQAAPRAKESRPLIGGYEILGELGRGGMGHVYLAQQKGLRRRVALKVLPQRMVTKTARERFEREARAVARLEHPGIVRVYESGDDAGQPWFAMELVTGTTLAAVLHDLRALSKPAASLTAADFARAARVEGTTGKSYAGIVADVVRQVAEALAFAHDRGVIHRDVKPSNVMLRSDGRALLFDFGLADVEEERSLTLSGDFLGTPHYASPEQAAGAVRDLDGRTDVWSLGATLYEALTLRPPFDGPTTQVILSDIASREPTRPRSECASIPRDLETVCLAALEKDRTKRYRSAGDFAADLAAFLDGRPVAARRAGPAERVWRWTKRHPARAAAAVLAAGLFVGTPTALYLQQRAANESIRDERDKVAAALRTAEEERDSARAVRDFMTGVFREADAGLAGPDAKIADALAGAATDAGSQFADRPRQRAEVCAVIASTYTSLSLFEQAQALATTTLAAVEPALGSDSPQVLDLRAALVGALTEAGDVEGGLRESGDLWRTARKALGDDDQRTLNAGIAWAFALSAANRADESVAVLRELIPRLVRVFGAGGTYTLRAQMNLGLLLDATQPDGEALSLLRTAYEGWTRALGPTNGNTLDAALNYGQALKMLGRLADAEPILTAAADGSRRTLGLGNSTTVAAIHNLAGLHMDANRLDVAVALQQELADQIPAGNMTALPVQAAVLAQLALLRVQRGELDAAERAGTSAIAVAWQCGQAAPAENSAFLVASVRIKLGRLDDAATCVRDALVAAKEGGFEYSGELVGLAKDIAAKLRAAGSVDAAAALEVVIPK
ncbi:MAG: serine/threonine-protein kinase [Planctomycetes bacterium]|nr:serine/threonine-protein kinase [Planctomycetota bacterium]